MFYSQQLRLNPLRQQLSHRTTVVQGISSPTRTPLIRRTIATSFACANTSVTRTAAAARSLQNHRRLHTLCKRSRLHTTATVLKSASFISFLGSLFSSSARAEEDNMSYPDKRTEDEWRAVLSPGMLCCVSTMENPCYFTIIAIFRFYSDNWLVLSSSRAIPGPPSKRD